MSPISPASLSEAAERQITDASRAPVSESALVRRSDELLAPCLIRTANGEDFTGRLPAWRHRSIHMWMLHARNALRVELVAGRRPNREEKVRIYTRGWKDHFLPGGAARRPGIDRLLAKAERHHNSGAEVFIGPAWRALPSGLKWHTTYTGHLWLDVDDASLLDEVYAFIETPAPGLPHGRRPSLVIHSGRGAHFYFPLAHPLPALIVRTPDGRTIVNPPITRMDGPHPEGFADPQTGELLDPECRVIEPIERANLRLAHAIGHHFDEHGRQIATVADEAVAKRSQPMRLAGTINGKVDTFARIIFADATVAGYRITDLVGGLADPEHRALERPLQAVKGAERYSGPDPYKHLDLREVYMALTGRSVPRSGRVRCPNPAHEDKEPSCDMTGWLIKCWVCPFAGDVYHLVAALTGGPVGGQLSREEFLAAKRWLIDRYGHLDQPARPAIQTGAAPRGALPAATGGTLPSKEIAAATSPPARMRRLP